MVGPPAPAPASPPSSSPPGLRSPRLDRSRSGDRQPPHPPDVPLQASPSTSSPPGGRSARRGGDHQHPHPPDAPLEATPGSASSAPGRRSGSRGRRSGGDRQPQPQPPPPPAAAVAFQASVPPRRSFRISLRSHVRVLPLEKPAVTRKTRDPARPRGPSIETLVSEWAKEKAASGATQEECILPFLQTGAPKKVECLICSKSIVPGDSMLCAVRRCQNLLHKDCSKRSSGCCPRHMCFYCKKKPTWHHVKHTMPACTDCSLQQNRMVDSVDLSKIMVSWSLWPSTSEDAGPADGIEEAFRRLPLPYIDQEFNIDPIKKEELDNGTDPPPYVHLKHNAYLVKNKCDDDSIQGGCTNCDPAFTCKLGCSCRSLSISCSPACHCSVKCTNRPFRREKKIEIVKTQHCGWGARALEAIEKGDFVIEFVGEVIDEETCKERLEDMRRRGDKNFYMCKVKKDFIIDATFRGNACRFFNHSCEPNCQLQRWGVNGKTRLGVFASVAIEVGEPLTYHYRFEQYFGPAIECFCGAQNCQGNLSMID